MGRCKMSEVVGGVALIISCDNRACPRYGREFFTQNASFRQCRKDAYRYGWRITRRFDTPARLKGTKAWLCPECR